MGKILIADDEEHVRLTLREVLRRDGFEIDEAEDGQQALEMALASSYDVIILDVKMPRMDGFEAMTRIKAERPAQICLIVTAYGSPKIGLKAIETGAYDYFSKPFEIEELRIVVRRAMERGRLERQVRDLKQQLEEPGPGFQKILGHSPGMQRMFELIRRVADSDVSVLVAGESGTGKELVGQALHDLSPRREGPLIKINCAAIPEQLLESELFGHERGAFTGAVQKKPGKFELANGGTLFLDEIGEIPLSLQPKLLRALQEREIQRVGGTETISIDIRLVAATNRDLLKQVEEKAFREDLYFRLNVITIEIPPLRERSGDVPVLAAHFLSAYARRFGKPVRSIADEALAMLGAYSWPGNVRELENAIQRAIVLASGETILPENLPPELTSAAAPAAPGAASAAAGESEMGAGDFDFSHSLADRAAEAMARVEKQAIVAALEKVDGKRQEAADLLGISRKSLHNKMQKYGLFE